MTHEPIDISSIGFICQQLQTSIGLILSTADELAIRRSLINGVPHFTATDIDLIRQKLLAELRLRESQVLDQRSNIS